jgi:hypothetical protein
VKSSDGREKEAFAIRRISFLRKKKENKKRRESLKQRRKRNWTDGIHLEKWASSDVGCGTDGDPDITE